MTSRKRKIFSHGETKGIKRYHKEDKFTLVSCNINNSHCHYVLKDINRLYAESELARINNEYLRSVDFLQEAYNKTRELNESSCIKCVNLFQSNINQTLKIMKDELNKMSHGLLGSRNYQLAYRKLCNLEQKVSQM